MRLDNNIIEDKRKSRELVIISSKKSPDLNKLIPYRLPDNRTIIYFSKDKSDKQVKETLAKYIKHTAFLGESTGLDNNFIRTKGSKYED